ncbi:type III-A CRISPR-associated RAMP protein Csm3 [Desulfurobacterium atlanticum]|uniref:CRISPR system Cms endoribonuclease Csm3 n=1 Tax=Desulfurobacterium atlanticum TaxID=240169 RepID=A0A238XWP6_9BACT|nr:type III-A CRISPR-associated RAMP protein Csm3 [Desulfurobacterium atlanticum]SNR62951.1 CRISPR-associated protein, Csm3 family [Desulfurobacterium atlanticum]
MEEQRYHFYGNVLIPFRLEVVTGLHIGGSKEGFDIGGVDNPVIKLPFDVKVKSEFSGEEYVVPREFPYIPGSSLKGKIRSLLEWENNLVREDGSPTADPDSAVGKVFGIADSDREKRKKAGPVRLRVFDSYISKDSIENDFYTELKYENSINRITSEANPRPFERVPAGTVFEGRFLLKLFAREDVDFLNLIETGMKLLEDDYLGGGGSRGSGRVRFSDIRIVFRDKKFYKGECKEKIFTDFRNAIEEIKKTIG